MSQDLQLPATYTHTPDTLDEFAYDVRLTPETTRRILAECGVNFDDTDPVELVHLASVHEAAEGDDEERLRVALGTLADYRGTPTAERKDPDDPTGELQINAICKKHGLDLDKFIADISEYGYVHLACAHCGSVDMRQVQYDQIDEAEVRHPLQFAYYVLETFEVYVEYIPDEIGSDEDPAQVGIECMDCYSMHDQGDLVVAQAARRSMAARLPDSPNAQRWLVAHPVSTLRLGTA